MPDQSGTVSYLMVPLETSATSFCYYENPAYYSAGGDFVPFAVLQRIHEYAQATKSTINFLYGNNQLPKNYDDFIEQTDHVKILPLKLKEFYNEGLFVVNRDDIDLVDSLQLDSQLTCIFRAEKTILPNLAGRIKTLLSKSRRLNLVMLDIGSYSDLELEEYHVQLAHIKDNLLESIKKGRTVELNVLTDRLLLKSMNNCNAGIVHLTVGGKGNFYLCPGFYHSDESQSAGSIDTGILIKNGRLLLLENAPICSLCDAYQCKRCVFLNNQLTLEINTPSRQQCVISHLERNCTGILREDLLELTHNPTAFAPIPELPYLDPLEVLLREEKRIFKKPKNAAKPISAVNI